VFDSGNFQSALPIYVEAGRAARARECSDIFTLAQTQRQIAILKSINGDHTGAVTHLENLHSITRTASLQYPSLWYDYLNSFAVELGEIGRLEEARNLSRIVLATPYASAYPEWQETGKDLALKGYRPPRSVVSFARTTPACNIFHSPCNILRLPERELGDNPISPFSKPAGVVSLKDWKKKMVKEPNGNNAKDELPENMTEKDMIIKLLQLTAYEGVNEAKLRKVLEYALKVMSDPNDE
jgi:hypothetical protein